MKPNPVMELARSVALVTQKIREMRLQAVLLGIAKRKNPSRRFKNAEAELTAQLKRQLQSGPVIDELLEDIEALLCSEK